MFQAQDNVITLGEERVAESFQDEWREGGETHHGEGEVGNEFIDVRLVVQRLCDSRVARVDRRDNTQVDLEVLPLCVDVVQFAVVVVVHLAYDGDGVVSVLNNVIVVQPDEAKV